MLKWKKVFSLFFVKSINWSGKTRWPGSISSRREPTAVAASICVQPNSFNAQMLALKFTWDGLMVCSLPWRAKMAICTPSICPNVNFDEGLPYGVSIFILSGLFKMSGLSRPEPPIIPILIISTPLYGFQYAIEANSGENIRLIWHLGDEKKEGDTRPQRLFYTWYHRIKLYF